MTPDERNMIMGLFDRMRSYGAVEKEGEAEALINAQVRQIPDAAYMLVQSVLVQEQSLVQANDRVQQLQARVRELEASGSKPAQSSSGGSFLGGLFGGGAKSVATSVPPVRPAMPTGGPWGSAPARAAQPQYAPQYQQPQYAQPMQAAPRAGGGFLAQAMTTAAGVAGGMMAANALQNMLGGGHHNHHNDTASASSTGVDQSTADAAQDDAQDRDYAGQADANDPGNSSASDDSGSWSGGDSTDA